MNPKISNTKVLLVCSAVILFTHFVFAADSTAKTGMAGPGFLEASSGGPKTIALFGFGSTAYLTYPSIWGILEITEAQGEDLQKAWNEIMVPVQDAYERGADANLVAKRKEAESEFKKILNDVLDEHQKEARSAANQFFGELGKEIAAQKLGGEAKKEAIETKVQTVFRPTLTAAQVANWDAIMIVGKNCQP